MRPCDSRWRYPAAKLDVRGANPRQSAERVRAPLLRMLACATKRGNKSAVHAHREMGVGALESELLASGVQLSVTQGIDPQSNGLAE